MLSTALLAALGGDPEPQGTLPLELEWTADPACPGEAEMKRRVAAMVVGSASGELRASALIRDREGSFELDLAWQLGPWSEHRILRSHDCDELGRLAAMLLASTWDPFGVLPREPEPEPQPEPPVEPEPTLPLLPEPASEPVESPSVIHAIEPEPEPRFPVRGLLLVDGFGVVNLLPHPGGGGRLALGLEVAKFRVLARGSGWFAPGFRSTTDPTVGGNLSAWSGELAGCGVPRRRHVEFPLCAQLGAGQIVGRGVGVNVAYPSGQPWAWLGADASLEWWVAPGIALVGGVGLGVSLVRPSFGVAGTDADFTVPAVFGQLHAGVTARFGRRTSPKPAKSDRREPDRQPSSP